MTVPQSDRTTTHPMTGRRIAILGMTAGKSTLAQQLTRLLGVRNGLLVRADCTEVASVGGVGMSGHNPCSV